MQSIPKLSLCCLFMILGLSGCSQSPFAWWKSLNSKAKQFNQLEARYAALLREHQRLEKNYFRLEHEYMDLRARVDSVSIGDQNLKATGQLNGRTPASITYQVPKGLRAEDTLTLAYEHFTEQRFAEAAATFEVLLKKPESAALVDASAVYTAGVAWFQLGNFHKAREYFEQAQSSASGDHKEKIRKKSDLWLRAIDRHQSERKLQHHQGGTLGG